MFVKIIFAGILIDSMRKLINSGAKEFYPSHGGLVSKKMI
jgi:glyoxylase-like metal-dependent hydrolase (beta-lactamase superfamily II)